MLAEDPDCAGSLGIAISEAVEDAAKHADTKYTLGSVLNHVMLHQTVIGLETIAQLRAAGEQADVVIGCTGGGSNFAGLVLPFIPRQIQSRPDLRFIAVEPTRVPVADERPVPLRLRRYRRPDAADEDVHARTHVHAVAASTPAGCGITAWRRSSAI